MKVQGTRDKEQGTRLRFNLHLSLVPCTLSLVPSTTLFFCETFNPRPSGTEFAHWYRLLIFTQIR